MSDAGGIYVVEVRLRRSNPIRVGQLGEIPFRAGAYLYVGSARRGLRARLERHARREKPRRWHIDYLTTVGAVEFAAVWPTEAVTECELARRVAQLAGEHSSVAGFGCSDCRCRSHLFYLGKRRLRDVAARFEGAGLVDLAK